MTTWVCMCQDSGGEVCLREMSEEEDEQDGMCSTCADLVWMDIYDGEEFHHDPSRKKAGT